MKNRKKIIRLNGNVVGSLIKGKNAVVYSGGKLYHTSCVIKIHDWSKDRVHFETVTAHYHLTLRPDSAAEIMLFPVVEMAA